MAASMPPTVPQSARTPHQIVRWWFVEKQANRAGQLPTAVLRLCAPTISTGPCPLTVAGPLAAWMPPRSLQGRTCSVSCDGGRARALQQNARSRGRGALTARRTRREPVHGGSMAASMPPTVPQSARTPHQIVRWWFVEEQANRAAQLSTALLRLCAPTISTGPCPLTVAGPLAAWMPPRSLQGRTCSVSCDGGRARALQHTCSVECAVSSTLAGHAVNPSMGARWRHPYRHRSRNRQGHRTRQVASCLAEEPTHRARTVLVAALRAPRIDHRG
ncbi:hypothetical protein GGR70_001408 [Xanthomonas campestris]|nr:hypothetical protein [Xanthomonas campestris]